METTLGPGCFYGRLSSSRKVDAFRLTEIIYPPNHRTAEHSHERAYFSLTLDGAYLKSYGPERVECTPQTLIFHPANQMESGLCPQSGGRSFIIEIDGKILARLGGHAMSPDRVSVIRGGPALWLATRLYAEFRHMDDLSGLAIEALTLELMVEAARRSHRSGRNLTPGWLSQTRDLLHSRFSEQLSMAEIAEAAGVHPVYLATEFRKRYGATIGDCIRQLRIDFACKQIATTETPLIQIALLAGFSSQSHFSTAFKRLTGLSPGAYRASLRSP
jgi:AraC family transcriptional regulator